MEKSASAARLARERQTIESMVAIYCRKKHHCEASLCDSPGRLPVATGHNRAMGLCCSCRDLLDYALQRIDKCPFQDDKPTCRQCPVHCYKKDRRDQIRQVMAYAGPWMLLYHPVLTALHYWDGGKKVNSKKKVNTKSVNSKKSE